MGLVEREVHLNDVAVWHRNMETACLQAASFARSAYGIGCEDALSVSNGWEEKAREHAKMATTIEAFAQAWAPQEEKP
jgi:hypothetical protein